MDRARRRRRAGDRPLQALRAAVPEADIPATPVPRGSGERRSRTRSTPRCRRAPPRSPPPPTAPAPSCTRRSSASGSGSKRCSPSRAARSTPTCSASSTTCARTPASTSRGACARARSGSTDRSTSRRPHREAGAADRPGRGRPRSRRVPDPQRHRAMLDGLLRGPGDRGPAQQDLARIESTTRYGGVRTDSSTRPQAGPTRSRCSGPPGPSAGSPSGSCWSRRPRGRACGRPPRPGRSPAVRSRSG